MAQSANSQSVYPSKTVINNDTVCIISMPQVHKLLGAYLNYDECQQISQSLQKSLNTSVKLNAEKDLIIGADARIISAKDSVIVQQNVIQGLDDKTIKKLNHKIAGAKLIGWLKFAAAGFGGWYVGKHL